MALLVCLFLLIGVPQPVFADVITEWNEAALAAIRSSRVAPPPAARALAILHVAMFDAVNGITRAYDSFAVRSDVPASASQEAAAAAAAHTVLTSLFPGSTAQFDTLRAATTAKLPDRPQKSRGEAWGVSVAQHVLLLRRNDNADATATSPVGGAPGSWEPTAPGHVPYLLPHWGGVTPFVLPAGSFVRPEGPPSLSSVEWAAEFNEAKVLGGMHGSTRTREQDEIALFWADGAGTATPAGHWNQIAQRVVADRPLGSLTATARLFAMLNVALADAAISAWDAKSEFNFWRPVTAIQNGDIDGNAETAADPGWQPFIVTPPFPEYVSGHSTFSAAAATILAAAFGTDDVAFAITSDGTPDVTRSFASFSDAAAEAAVSRLYGGIHFRSAIEDGLAMGVAIGNWTVGHFFTTAPNRSRR